jgi:hypothetical protein
MTAGSGALLIGEASPGDGEHSGEFVGEGFGDAPLLLDAALTALPATWPASICSAAVAPKATNRGFGASAKAAKSSFRWPASTSLMQ